MCNKLKILRFELIKIAQYFFESNKINLEKIITDPENKEYSGCSFQLNNQTIKFRAAKITPKKQGQFVTFYKRIGSNPIQPYDFFDPFDFLMVSVSAEKNCGYFLFSKDILLKQKLISAENKEGKRAFRVYAPWDKNLNRQAKKTQDWQCEYFVAC